MRYTSASYQRARGNTMPEHLRKRQQGGEEARFIWAFDECLRRNPGWAPTPTAINILLEKRPPYNILPSRLSKLRRTLLLDAGFTQDNRGGRWYLPNPPVTGKRDE